jgi:hypothetical protein
MAMNSASHDDNATVGCFLVFHLIGAPPNVVIYPVVDRLSSMSPAQSESVYLVSCPPAIGV